MIAVDTSILVYAHREDSRHHHRASEVLEGLASGRGAWGIPWACLHEFLAIVSHPRIYRPATPMAVAVAAVDALLSLPNIRVLAETQDHATILADLLRTSGITGPKVHDARVAAICLGHGIESLYSADRDFSWFPRLAVVNPLTA